MTISKKKVLGLLLALTFVLPTFASQPTHSSKNVSSTVSTPVQADQGNPDVKVWVNTNSGVYHCPAPLQPEFFKALPKPL